VRALVIGALGLSLIGCSHQLPPQAALVSCTGPGDPTCATGQPQPMWVKAPYAAPDSKPALAVNIAESKITESRRPAHVRARVLLARRLAAPAKQATVATQAAPGPHVPLPVSAPPRPATSAATAMAADAPPAATKGAPEPKAAPQPVAVVTAAASQPNAKERAAAKAGPAPSDNPDLLVAVVMARPDISSVANLAGKIVAIDDRYAKSIGTVRIAIVAAGAPEVQLSEGATTAINRLTSGEVPAAVVALVSPDATETFPDIKGFKIFRVPLSPRAAGAR
jgi:hypothetical protein